MDTSLSTAHLRSIVHTYRVYKDLGERAIAQVKSDSDLHRQLDPDSNSIAVTVKHVGGNLRSRFRDFLTTDGEKPDRKRDTEFEVEELVTREEILRWWNEGWAIVLGSVEALKPEDLGRTITIRGEKLLVTEALNRSLAHTAYHVGQIVYLARHFASGEWTSLTIPKGRSAEAVGAWKQYGAPQR